MYMKKNLFLVSFQFYTFTFSSQIVSTFAGSGSYGYLGQEVYCNVIDKPQFEVTKTWQGEGMYFIKIYNENKNLIGTKKIILQ